MKVLVVSHDASRTGAPMVMLRMLGGLEPGAAELRVASLAGGPLLPQLRALGGGDVSVLPRALDWRRTPRQLSRNVAADRLLDAWLRRVSRGCDVAYVNTGTTGRVVRALQQLGIPVVVHVHELGHWLRTRVEPADVAASVAAERLIACAQPVARALVDEFGADEHRVTVLPEVPGVTAERGPFNAALADLGLTRAGPLVGGSGTVDARKGPDLFLLAVAPLLRADLDLQAVWMGDKNDPSFAGWVEHDVRHMGLTGRVHFVGGLSRPADLMQGFSVLALTSREDPYPLVMLEAAALRVPVVAWAGSGGADDFLAEGRGTLVPYGDVAGFAAAVRVCLSGPDPAQLDRAQAHAIDDHRPEDAARRILAVLGEAVSAR
jgi:glycosyltransferase involved in cell wall biosynthesis